MPQPPPQFDTYECIVRCIAEQLRQSGQMPDGTNALDLAKQAFPWDFWKNFSSLPWDQKKTIELLDDLFLELEKKGNKVSAILLQKVMDGRVVEIAKW